MNKYATQSRLARKLRARRKMCSDKRRYPTAAAALQRGQRTYHCPHCRGWHRSGQLASLIAEVKR